MNADIGGYDGAGPRPADKGQNVLNESWPLKDKNGHHARGIPDQQPIAVTVRIVFERDGETWLDGHAMRWHGKHAYVTVGDERVLARGVWVDAGDVKRR